jgi:pilus assembly protein CpaE
VIHAVVHDRDPRVSSILVELLSRAPELDLVESTDDWALLRKNVALHMRSVVVLGPEATDADLKQVLAVAREYPGVAFVQVVDVVDAQVLKNAMRHGIRDVVAVDESEAELAPAVVRGHAMVESELGARRQRPEESANGKVVTIFGPKGGTGKTIVATNLAVLSAEAGVSTGLLDAAIRFGDCAAFLRIRPERTLADVAGVQGELDEPALRSILSTHGSGLRVLCAPNDPLFDAEKIENKAVSRAIQALRKSFELVVVDTGPSLDAFTLEALAECDLAYLVTSLELPAVKDAKLCLVALEKLHVKLDKVRVILNRANSKVGFPPDEVGKALGRRVVAELPSDVSVPRSVNNGVGLHTESPKAKISKGLSDLAANIRKELLSADQPAASRSRLSRVPRPSPAQS